MCRFWIMITSAPQKFNTRLLCAGVCACLRCPRYCKIYAFSAHNMPLGHGQHFFCCLSRKSIHFLPFKAEVLLTHKKLHCLVMCVNGCVYELLLLGLCVFVGGWVSDWISEWVGKWCKHYTYALAFLWHFEPMLRNAQRIKTQTHTCTKHIRKKSSAPWVAQMWRCCKADGTEQTSQKASIRTQNIFSK